MIFREGSLFVVWELVGLVVWRSFVWSVIPFDCVIDRFAFQYPTFSLFSCCHFQSSCTVLSISPSFLALNDYLWWDFVGSLLVSYSLSNSLSCWEWFRALLCISWCFWYISHGVCLVNEFLKHHCGWNLWCASISSSASGKTTLHNI